MSYSAAVVIATFILATTAIVLLVLISSRKRAAKEEELKRAASARGWKFEAGSHRGYRVHTWSGTTDGVPWRAESLDYVSRNSKQNRPDVARWHAEWNTGVGQPILLMAVPPGKELPHAPMQQGEGLLAQLAQKAVGFAFDKAVDVYFGETLGKQVDAGALHRVTSTLPGFIVMAADKDEGARVLAHGLERSLASAAHDPHSVFSRQDPPWILLRPAGLSLARMQRFRDLDEIDSFTRSGLAQIRSSKFARPFA
jgi:hypothetical protein